MYLKNFETLHTVYVSQGNGYGNIIPTSTQKKEDFCPNMW